MITKVVQHLFPTPLKHRLSEWLLRHLEETNIRVIDGCLASGFIGPKQYDELKSLDLSREYLDAEFTRELRLGFFKRLVVWVLVSASVVGQSRTPSVR